MDTGNRDSHVEYEQPWQIYNFQSYREKITTGTYAQMQPLSIYSITIFIYDLIKYKKVQFF